VYDFMTNKSYLIAVIGDAILHKDSKKYILAENLGHNLIDNGYLILTKVTDGITEAVSNGARASSNYKDGDIIGILPRNVQNIANSFVDICLQPGLDL